MRSATKTLDSITRSIISWVILILLPFYAEAQLNCSTTHANDSIITRCFHKNRIVSTIEIWDKDIRWGSIKAYDSSGNEILHYGLRSFAGHASITLSYHPNGQVRKAYYSSAPDGGIQFYKIYHEFNETGEQISFSDFSQPDGHPVLMVPKVNPQMPDIRMHPVKDPPPPYQEDKYIVPVPDPVPLPDPAPDPDQDPNPAICAVPYQTVFKVINETSRAISVDLTPLYAQWAYLKPYKNIMIPARQSFYADSVVIAERFLPVDQSYTVEASYKRGKRKLRVISAMPLEQGLRRVYIWHVVK
ncbi:MAG: hypothetical protein ACFCUM_09940 [Bacteroidales bacterium]